MTRYPRLATTAAAILVLGATAGACAGAGEKSESDLKGDLTEEIRDDNPDLDEEQADCLAEVIIDVVGVDALREVDFDAEDPGADLGPQLVEAAREARDRCELDTEPQENEE